VELLTSWLPTPLLRFPPFHSEAEVVAELAHLVLVAHRDQPDPRATQVLLALPDLRAMLVNADQKALGVFRVLLVPLVAELEEPRFPDPKDLGVLLALLDQRGSRAFRVLLGLRAITAFLAPPDPLVPPEQMVNPDPRAITVQSDPLALLDRRVLPDLLESVARPVRMQSPLSLTSISPRTRQPRPTARRLMLKTHSDRPIHSRTAHGTTLR
jgi:hypothetical protein